MLCQPDRQRDHILRLAAIEPDGLDESRKLSSPSAAIFSGVSAAGNSAAVALLTPLSVACAESTTATSSVYGLTYCSSVLGSGLAGRSGGMRPRPPAGVHVSVCRPLFSGLSCVRLLGSSCVPWNGYNDGHEREQR